MSNLKLFTIHDDWHDLLMPEERYYAAIWHHDRASAIRHYVNHIGSLEDYGDRLVARVANVSEDSKVMEFTPDEPGEECRCRVLRLAGWGYDGEYLRCESCGLLPMGEVPMCHECCTCDECGCVCEQTRGVIMTNAEFAEKVLKLFAQHDAREYLSWTIDGCGNLKFYAEPGDYPGPTQITPENFEQLVTAFRDCKRVAEGSEVYHWPALLFACRIERFRLPEVFKPDEDWLMPLKELFDAIEEGSDDANADQ